MPRSRFCVFLFVALVACTAMLLSGTAQAADVHTFEAKPTEAISQAAKTCTGPGTVTGPLGEVNALTVDEGHLWLAEEKETQSGERVDEFSAATGACEQQLEQPASLEKGFTSQGIAVGHSTGEREVYVGSLNPFVRNPIDVVGVFGPSGALQATWTGANTPGGSFAASGGATESNVTGVAVDETAGSWASGDVFVSTGQNAPTGVVDVFTPEAALKGKEGTYVTQLTGTCESTGEVAVGLLPCSGSKLVPFEGGVRSIAVDPGNGDLVVAEQGRHVLDLFEPTGIDEYTYLRQITGTSGSQPFAFGILALAAGGGVGKSDIYVVEEGNPRIVDEFNFEGVFLGSLEGTPAGSFVRVRSVAVDPASGDVFVGDDRTEDSEPDVVDVFGPDVVVPDAVTGAASELSATTAVLNGTVDPLSSETSEGAECEFEYGPTAAYGHKAGCEPRDVAEGGTPASVRSEQVSGLLSGTTYHFRLVARNAKGSFDGTDETFTTKGPGVVSASVSDVKATSATLNATIDPDGAPTSYFFQYSTSDTEGCTSTTCTAVPGEPGAPLGEGSEEIVVASQHVQGLAAGTTYHYRVVAVSDVEVTPGHTESHQFASVDHTFKTQGAGEFGLPDGRAWEMVSPPNKYGALLGAIDQAGGNGGTVIQAAANGGAVTYIANAPTEPQPAGYASETQVYSTRTSTGWSSHDLTIPHAGATDASVSSGGEYRFFSEDLSSAIVQPLGSFVPLSAEASEATAYVHSLSSGAYTPLVTHPGDDTASPFEPFGGNMDAIGSPGAPCPPELTCGPLFVGATPDTRHVVLQSRVALTQTPIPGGAPQLYEWSGGQLVLVSVLPQGEGGGPPVDGAVLGGGLELRGAVSGDGSRVFFANSSRTQVYVRDTAREQEQTLRLDVPEAGCVAGGTCGQGAAAAVFQVASVDGSRVLFSDSQRLTADASSGAPDLYECVIVETAGRLSCELSDLTPRNLAGEPGGLVGSVVGASVDGAIVYFVSNEVLENGGVPVAGAVAGAANLYMRRGGVTSLVTELASGDQTDVETPERLTARVSPDGRYLAFMSDGAPTGYDNRDAASGRSDEELYEYDAHTGRLACVSCDPSGARPSGVEYGKEGENMRLVGGNKVWEASSWLAADVPGWTPYRLEEALFDSRYLSNTGRLFFNARSPLVPADVNNQWDVYQYEPENVGSCTSSTGSGSDVFKPAHPFQIEVAGKQQQGEEGAGCVGLISSGESSQESAFLEASAGGGEGEHGEPGSEPGRDVFFLTTGKLSPQDYDNSLDVYDAHECTSESPCTQPAATPPPCDNESSCKASPTPQPGIYGLPSSATFSGPGNATPEGTKPATGSTAPPCSSSQGAPSSKCTKKQNLTKALATCKRTYPHSKKKRNTCEAAARHKYGAVKKAKKKK